MCSGARPPTFAGPSAGGSAGHWGEACLLILPPLLVQWLAVVPAVLGLVPLVQSVLFQLCHRDEVGIVSGQDIRLLIWLVVLQNHPVLLGRRRPLLIINWLRSRLPHVVPGGGTCHSSGDGLGHRSGSISCHQRSGSVPDTVHFVMYLL